MNILKKIALTLLVFASPLSYASGYTPPGTVTRIMLYEGHHGVLIRHSVMSDPDSCGRADWFILPETYFRFKEAYAMLLAANLANKRVLIYVSGCLQGLPQIQHIDIVAD